MTNKDRQHSLDNQKWIESQQEHVDKTGGMFYCDSCEYQEQKPWHNSCKATQEQRESQCLCAKSFNRLKRKKVIDK